ALSEHKTLSISWSHYPKVSLRFINNTFWRRAPVQKDELSFSASHVKRWFALLQGRRLPTISARCPAGVARRRDVRYE
ncbi:TPA: hypothetical protein ACSBDI_004378, partial [Shigella sonnei]|uniref:hypothetical protein n=1 Tax=Shigella sonnei TaxID=624 RepID=UPI001C0A7617